MLNTRLLIPPLVLFTATLAVLAVTSRRSERERLRDARALILRACGAAPHAPGYAVSTDEPNGAVRVSMAWETFRAIQAYETAADVWSGCVEGRRY